MLLGEKKGEGRERVDRFLTLLSKMLMGGCGCSCCWSVVVVVVVVIEVEVDWRNGGAGGCLWKKMKTLCLGWKKWMW